MQSYKGGEIPENQDGKRWAKHSAPRPARSYTQSRKQTVATPASTSDLKIVLAIKKASHEFLTRQRPQLVSSKSQSALKCGENSECSLEK
jgi:hypothetical protein